MYSGSGGSSNMLYGGPLGAYLSGVYQSGSSTCPRRGSLYGSSGSGSGSGAGGSTTAASVNSGSSIYYTPQPTRRKFGGSADSVGSSDSGRGLSPRRSTYTPRWSAGSGYSGSDSNLDYKKLYEQQLAENEEARAELERVRRRLEESRGEVAALRDGRRPGDPKALEKKLQQCEEEVKALAGLKVENQKIKGENVALIRVISKLSK